MRVVVGRIGRPHGIRGEVTVEVRTDEPEERFAPGAVLFADVPAGSLAIERTHWHSGRLLVTFTGVDDRNAAEALRGILLEVERDDAETPAEDDEYYDSTLVGCQVQTVSGVDLGRVTEVAHLPAQDLLVVDVDGREVLIPFVSEIVPTVDVSARLVIIDPPGGLLDPEQ